MKSPLALIGSIRWRLLAASLVGAGILHICVTLVAPYLSTASAYGRLAAVLPLNVMKVLPPIGADNQPLPFMSPDSRYAMCSFDTRAGPVFLKARLPDAGWSIALYAESGANLYVAVGSPEARSDLKVLLVPSDDRFMGLTPEAGGIANPTLGAQQIAARRGVIVIRAPDRGFAYAAEIERELSTASCAARPY